MSRNVDSPSTLFGEQRQSNGEQRQRAEESRGEQEKQRRSRGEAEEKQRRSRGEEEKQRRGERRSWVCILTSVSFIFVSLEIVLHVVLTDC